MFNNKDNEADFCESYKSQILGTKKREKGESFLSTLLKLLTILILLVIIMGVSFYGYNYFMNHKKLNNATVPPVSMQISDDDLVVKMEEVAPEPKEIKLEKEDEVIVKKVESIKKEVIKEEVIEKKEIIEKEVIKKEKIIETEEIIKKEVETIFLPLVTTANIEESDMEKMANAVKIAIAKSELKEENETKVEKVEEINEEVESLEVPTSAPEAQYLEELADLSKQIDKDRNN